MNDIKENEQSKMVAFYLIHQKANSISNDLEVCE
jgi:hypothetical protein